MRLCMLGLAELKDAWPIAGWILRLFDQIASELSSEKPMLMPVSERIQQDSQQQPFPCRSGASEPESDIQAAAMYAAQPETQFMNSNERFHPSINPYGSGLYDMSPFSSQNLSFWSYASLPSVLDGQEFGSVLNPEITNEGSITHS